MVIKYFAGVFLTLSFCTVGVYGQSKTSTAECKDGDACCKKTAAKTSSNSQSFMQVADVRKDKAVACKLTSPELQKRKAEVIASLKSKVVERKELENGYQYSFKGSDEMLDELVSFIKTERACCGFFTFHLSVEDEEANVVLTISGPKGAKEFIDAEIEL